MNSLEIKDQREQLKKRAFEIIDTCKKEVRDLTEDETTELEDLKEKIKQKDEELKELRKTHKNWIQGRNKGYEVVWPLSL